MSVSRTAELVARVARWRRAAHPATPPLADGDRAAAAMKDGADASEALAASGAHPGLIAMVRVSNPADMDAFLESLATVLGRAEERRRALHGAAMYPGLLALSGAVLAAVLVFAVRPAAGVIAGAETGVYAPAPMAPAIAAVVVSIAALTYLALALRADAPVFPFAEAKARQERAVILGAAAVAAANGTPLHAALAGAAGLSTSPRLANDARRIAAALESGATALPSSGLMGPLGGALFSLAATQGEGSGAIGALAEAAEAGATADLPNQVLRAELTSMLVASAAITISGVGIFQTYASSFSN